MEKIDKNLYSGFFEGKKVFLTGHTGFKGAWCSILLKNLGAKVYGYSLPPEDTRGNLFKLLNSESFFEKSEFADITDAETLTSAISAFKPDIIMHMAAQAFVRRSYNNPVSNYASNVMGVVNIFEAARKLKNDVIVLNVTTDKCYENRETLIPYRETDRLGGHDPYSASKACSELITISYNKSFFNEGNVRLASARAGNVIGGGDFSEDRLIPDIVDSIKNGRAISLRYPDAVRPWQHVLECLNGYLTLISKIGMNERKYCTAYNFGPDNDEKELNVKEITEIFISKIGSGSYEVEKNIQHFHEAGLLKLDNSKAKQELSWKPKLSAEEAISFTAAWYSYYLANINSPDKITAYTQSQITEFFKL